MTSTQYRMLMGLLAGVVGGMIFTLLVPQASVILNVLWGALLGGLFPLLLGERTDSAGAALVWGEAYGLFWWAAAALTIFPLLSGQGLLWSIESLRALTPHLLGYLLGYGVLVAEGYYLLTGPLSRFMPIQPAAPAAETRATQQPYTPSPPRTFKR